MVRHFNFIYILCTSKLACHVFVSPLQQVIVPCSLHLCPCFFNTNTQNTCPIEAKVNFGIHTYRKCATLKAAPIESMHCAYQKHSFVEPIKSSVFLCLTKAQEITCQFLSLLKATEMLDTIFEKLNEKNDKRKTSLSKISCYNCGGRGHYKSDCPSTKIEKKESASTVIENEEDKEDFEF